MNVAEWPGPLQPIAKYYGPERVWKTGLRVLGYPATWAHTAKERNRIADSLRKETE